MRTQQRAPEPRTPRLRTCGLSLIELLVALAVLSIGVLALALAQVGALRATQRSDRLRQAAAVVASEMADLRSVPRSLGNGPCQTSGGTGDGRSMSCQVDLVCARWAAAVCRVAAVKIALVGPDGVVREAHGAVRWPAGRGGPP